jgi:hypothetical protein
MFGELLEKCEENHQDQPNLDYESALYHFNLGFGSVS